MEANIDNPVTPAMTSTEEILTPIIPLIPTKGYLEHATRGDLVLIAVKTYQNQITKDSAAKSRYILATQKDISEKIYEMTDGRVLISQSAISKILRWFDAHKLNINGKIYRIGKTGGSYALTEGDDLSKQALDLISSNDVFFNNPNGISTIFAVKAVPDNHETVCMWLRQMIDRDLFNLFIKNDTVFALLRVDTTTYKTTSRKLKAALTGDGLKNTNYALRNFAKSWKE